MTKQPWMMFYPSDWRSDPALGMCSIGARGLWIEMLALMHEAEPRGHLLIKGVSPTVDQLAMLVRVDKVEVEKLLAELESQGVFSRKKSGVIFSRRIEKDENRKRKNRENGKKGGNPSLCKQKEKGKSVNREDKPHIPYSRDHIDSVTNVTGADAPEKVGADDPPNLSLLKPKDEDLQAALFGECLLYLSATLKLKPDRLRGLLGKWIKDAGNDRRRVFQAIAQAQQQEVADPRAWVTKALELKPEAVKKPTVGWDSAVRHFRSSGTWSPNWGPPPNDPRCVVAEPILKRHGYRTKAA